MMILTIPTPDPMPLPGPVWLLRTLLFVTFFLHVIAMNFTLGGGVIAAVAALRRKRDEVAAQLAKQLAGMLPVLMAFTITLGVAALLFVQVLYGNLLYASSILIGGPWMSVIGLLIVAYYAFYWSSMRKSVAGALLAGAAMVAIGFIYVNNMTLMLTPERWVAMYRGNPSGWHFNLGESTLAPRYLHMMLGALAIGGVLVVILGLLKDDPEQKRQLVRQGAMWFTVPTMLNILVGFWLLIELPNNVRALFMGQDLFATELLALGMLLPIAAVVHLMLAPRGSKTNRQAIIGVGSALASIAAMILLRDVVRGAYLEPYFSLQQLQVSPQWSVILLFVVLFVGGLATVYWMLRKLSDAKAEVKSESVAAG